MTNISETELKSIFNQPPEKVIEFFEAKGLKTSYDWHEVYADSHSKAFTVAKMTEIDLLKDTKNILDKAIKEGESYGETKKQLKELFERKGWTGTRIDVDSEGNAKKVELGTPRRIRTIINSNINSAYASGRYLEQMQETDFAPYWQYMAVNDESTRPEHRALHLKVYKSTDPFWQNFYPPNGWNCRCYVRNLTKRQVERLGYSVESTEGSFSTVNKKVGDEIKEIPAYKFNDGGIERTLIPDAGWETNVGNSAWGIDVAAWNKVKNLDENIKLDFLSKMAQNPHREQAFKTWTSKMFEKDYKNTELEKTLTWINPKLYEKIKPQSPIVVIQDSQIGHSGINKNTKQALSKEEYLQVYDIINNPDEIYEDYTYKDGKQIAFVKRIPNSEMCIKICVRFDQKSRLKDKRKRNELISRVTTVGKVDYQSFMNLKDYKKIE